MAKRKNQKLSEEDEALKQIAFDLFRGLIWTDRHVKNERDMRFVFMPLALMDAETLKELEKDPPGLIYEYLDRGTRWGINGNPTFFSFSTLSKEKTERMLEFYEQFKQMKDQVK